MGQHAGEGAGCLGELEEAGVVGGPWVGALGAGRGEGPAEGQGDALGAVQVEAGGAWAPVGLLAYPWA